ncbi:chromosome transmission fidelity protein 18 homolog [Aricia agestis]|uniref:chromosome transmission fidelity protein 18 homolog n=1 Tax=Aricia agestis TaxID=91739 RepID=UPI001C209C36|nr:chromosome transmission fidelity protein 18 homolog [Aricia agestis]XP_041982036.1 chromosome transmission fidelity protein 18 homolog [Aricia agestis]
MADFPDPDEEYELMYSTEYEMLREMDEQNPEQNPVKKKVLPAKRSLDFSSPVSAKKNDIINETIKSQVINNNHEISLTPSLQAMEDVSDNTSNKRTAEDLFGDIDDIDFNTIEQPSKKQKTDEEKDLELIERIIANRQMRQMLMEPSSKLIVNKQNYNVKDNISLDIPSWAFYPVTQSSGERMYVKFLSEETFEESIDAVTEKLTLHDTYASVWEEARKILETKEQEESVQATQQELLDISVSVNAELWVDKYRPQSYVDLLSEEPVNRALLHWLHLWDKIVFKKEVKTREPHQRNRFVKRTGQFQMTNTWKGKKEAEPEIDEDGRPHHKVALICGPPGVGKTTLAHLLARLAGYRPVELNASDERSTEAFQTALQSATQMRSVIDAEKRPNCLILDEIDGAPAQTVELLVKWCTASSKKEEGGKKKNKTQLLRRPVIAICNDLYATSLRTLRPVSLIIRAGCVGTARLGARLAALAKAEHVRTAARALPALAARAAGDVRAAIHALSFLRARGAGQITVEDVEKTAIGAKDHTRSMMEALQAIFTIHDTESEAILRTIQAAGEYDRLADGIFENYLTARVDARLHIACEASSWLQLFDTVHSWTQRTQNYTMYGALPYILSRCHQLLASRQPQKIKFPTQAQEMFRKKAELDGITWSVWRGSCPQVACARRTLRVDVLPLLPYLLAPQLRSANVQLCSDAEKRLVRTVAGAMCEYGVRYTQQRTADGYVHALEPDIHRVAFLGNPDRAKPPPAIRQAIAREQQLEEIRRAEEMMTKPSKDKPAPKVSSSQPKTKPEEKTETRLPNHLQRLNPKALEKTTPQVHKDFFGRVVNVSQSQKQNASNDVISSSGVFYQYREGFNNAVRRNVRLRDLL